MNTNAPDGGSSAGPSARPGGASTNPPPPPQQPWQAGHVPPQESSFFSSLRRTGIWRGEDRWIGGVAAGVARRLDIDPLLVRGILVVLTLFGGLGLLLYGVGWALLPEESDGRIHLQEALRGNVDAALAGAVAFTIIGLARPGAWWGDWTGVDGPGFLWPLLALGGVALIILGVVALARRSSAPRPPYAAGPYAGTSYPGAPADRPVPPRPGGAAPAPRPGGAAPAPRPGGAPGPAAPPRPATAPFTSAAGPTTGATPWAPEPARAGGQPAYAAPSPPRPVEYRPPVPPRPRTPGPGSSLVAVVLALSLLVTAALLLWDRVEPIGWLLPLVVGGAVLALLGVGALVAGSMGRRGGVLSVLGILLALLVVPGTIAASVSPVDLDLGATRAFGDVRVTPTTAEDAERGVDLGAGDVHLDLTEVELGGDPVVVPVNIGAGDVRVVVPEAAAVTVRVELGAGEISTLTGPGWTDESGDTPFRSSSDPDARQRTTWASGVNITRELTSPASEDGADLVVVVTAGASDILIEEQR